MLTETLSNVSTCYVFVWCTGLKGKRDQENKRGIHPYAQQLDDPGRNKTSLLVTTPSTITRETFSGSYLAIKKTKPGLRIDFRK